MAQLHLLRRFFSWPGAETPEAMEAWVKARQATHPDHHIIAQTKRCPKRLEELKGGSVYFCRKKVIEFRMPLAGIRAIGDGRWQFEMKLDFIRVENVRVKFLRGWRYLEDDQVPDDIGMPADMPDDMEERLRKLGVLC